MGYRRETILVLEDSEKRIDRFERVLNVKLKHITMHIANNRDKMLSLIAQHLDQTAAVSLDHDLYVPNEEDPGDGLQVAAHLAELVLCCRVIIHSSNSDRGRQMQGVLEALGWDVRLAGTIGEDWVERDWITEIIGAYTASNP